MDNLTKIVRAEIARQYKSVRQFAFAVNVPLSTINSALHNGIGGSSYDTVVQICRTLGIKTISSDASFYLTDESKLLLDQYAHLDDYGRHTVTTVAQVEYDRCVKDGSAKGGKVAAFGDGLSDVSAASQAEAAKALRSIKSRKK